MRRCGVPARSTESETKRPSAYHHDSYSLSTLSLSSSATKDSMKSSGDLIVSRFMGAYIDPRTHPTQRRRPACFVYVREASCDFMDRSLTRQSTDPHKTTRNNNDDVTCLNRAALHLSSLCQTAAESVPR